jgi:hypothetical protein
LVINNESPLSNKPASLLLLREIVSQWSSRRNLQKERTRLENELNRVTAALTAFGKVYLRGSKPTLKTRTISAAGRKKIAAAQRARWAKIRAARK